jgi:hypothetical protein
MKMLGKRKEKNVKEFRNLRDRSSELFKSSEL